MDSNDTLFRANVPSTRPSSPPSCPPPYRPQAQACFPPSHLAFCSCSDLQLEAEFPASNARFYHYTQYNLGLAQLDTLRWVQPWWKLAVAEELIPLFEHLLRKFWVDARVERPTPQNETEVRPRSV